MAVAFMLWFGVRHSRPLGEGPTTSVAPRKGKTAPGFELVDLQSNKPVHLSDYKGKAVLLNFWATWCAPCKVEIPWFIDLQKQYGSQGLEIVGIAMDDAGRDKILEFAREMGINYTIVQGTDKVGDAYNVGGFPTSFFIGRDGTVVNSIPGLASHGDVERDVKQALSRGQQQAAAGAR
jgi:cytochrome c biogenesis protein CcmG/thiol:disulfide interchange protein DsbE